MVSWGAVLRLLEAIDRGRTAMSRMALSKPTQLALKDGVLKKGMTFFDYGCGKGGDLARLKALGWPEEDVHGWDPNHFPDEPLIKSDVVNFAYVLNVIEDQIERAATLRKAWALAKKVLVVSARTDSAALKGKGTPYADGVLTKNNTFQKFYGQSELQGLIEDTLSGVSKVESASSGIFYVWR